MIHELIPAYDPYVVWQYPWTDGLSSYGWVMLGGFLVAAACGLVGNFLILRRMALIGDAMSHGLLPGLVVAFLVFQTRSSLAMLVGAIVAGLVTTGLIEIIEKQARVKADAALGVVFTSLFAFGVVLISLFADHVDLDADCVLYGELAFVPLAQSVSIFGLAIPKPIVQLGCVCVVSSIVVWGLYKELVVVCFDKGYARALGLPVSTIHYTLMLLVSLALVASFEAVGVILVIAMLVFPGATAGLVSTRLPRILAITVLLAALYAILGLHLALYLDASIAGCMAVVAIAIFVGVWLVGLLIKKLSPLSVAPQQ
ncbi:MAG: hypothetical protein B7X06_01120 [Verrucomicrobia bacterium 21-51-4]|nr:MAG: hypothetical protein B7X06_01120 [Verrucomicrobia bacterium 21-51-4]HQU08478.1 metal ABC transporter permease [Opitutales bacterium]